MIDPREHPFTMMFDQLVEELKVQSMQYNPRPVSNRALSKLMNEYLPEEISIDEKGVQFGRWLDGSAVPSFDRCAAFQMVVRKFDLTFDLDQLWSYAVYQKLNEDDLRGIKWYIDRSKEVNG